MEDFAIRYSLGQCFPTFLVSWTLLTIWLEAVDPLNKTSKNPAQGHAAYSAESSFQLDFIIT